MSFYKCNRYYTKKKNSKETDKICEPATRVVVHKDGDPVSLRPTHDHNLSFSKEHAGHVDLKHIALACKTLS